MAKTNNPLVSSGGGGEDMTAGYVGEVCYFMDQTLREGYVWADGSQFTETEYPELAQYAIINKWQVGSETGSYLTPVISGSFSGWNMNYTLYAQIRAVTKSIKVETGTLDPNVIDYSQYSWKPGDKLSFTASSARFSLNQCGHITGSAKTIYCTLYLGRPITATKATITGATAAIRQTNNYIYKDSSQYGTSYWDINTGITTYCEIIADNMISLTFQNSIAWVNATNNTPLSLSFGSLEIEFS